MIHVEDWKGNAEAGAGNGASRNNAHLVRVHSIFRADCARAVVTLVGNKWAIIAVADSIPYWGSFEVERLIAEATERLELGKKKDGVMVKGGCALRIGINPFVLGEDEVIRAFVVDPECVGDVEYIARHALSGIVRPLRYGAEPVMAGAIVGRTLVLAVEGRIVVVSNPAVISSIFRKDGRIASSSEGTVQPMMHGATVMFGIEESKPVMRMRNPNGRIDVIAIDTAPVRGVRLVTSHAVLKPVTGPVPSPAI